LNEFDHAYYSQEETEDFDGIVNQMLAVPHAREDSASDVDESYAVDSDEEVNVGSEPESVSE